MDGEELDPDSFTAIARLPGREALNAQLAGVVASPLTGLVRGLGSMIQGLALQLGQIAEQGLVSGEAPADEAPADPEPPSRPRRAPRSRRRRARTPARARRRDQGGRRRPGEEPPAEEEPAEETSEQTSEDSENKEDSE